VGNYARVAGRSHGFYRWHATARLVLTFAYTLNSVNYFSIKWEHHPKTLNVVDFKGAMCNKVEYLFTEMQYDIHNYVFSGV